MKSAKFKYEGRFRFSFAVYCEVTLGKLMDRTEPLLTVQNFLLVLLCSDHVYRRDVPVAEYRVDQEALLRATPHFPALKLGAKI